MLQFCKLAENCLGNSEQCILWHHTKKESKSGCWAVITKRVSRNRSRRLNENWYANRRTKQKQNRIPRGKPTHEQKQKPNWYWAEAEQKLKRDRDGTQTELNGHVAFGTISTWHISLRSVSVRQPLSLRYLSVLFALRHVSVTRFSVSLRSAFRWSFQFRFLLTFWFPLLQPRSPVFS